MHHDSEAEHATAVARSALYAFLGRALAYPTPAHRAELAEMIVPVVSAVQTGDDDADRLVPEIIAALTLPLADARRAHTRVFTHIEPPDYPPYETAFDSADAFRQSAVMADVAGFYRAHGLQVGGVERERPDHAVTELEFMAFMARKEAYALEHFGTEQVEECRRTQVLFLRDHLGRWAPAFGRRLATFCDDPLFRSVGSLLERWIEIELAAWDAEPATRLESPHPAPPPDDGGCGFDPSECAAAAEHRIPIEIGRES